MMQPIKSQMCSRGCIALTFNLVCTSVTFYLLIG